MPSIPVAFFTFILLIHFSTTFGFTEENEKLFSSNSGWLFFISEILGIIVKPLTDIVNLSISTSTFPDRLKEAQVAPIHKKNSVLEKGNEKLFSSNSGWLFFISEILGWSPSTFI
jgi:hypothetical protein